MKTAMILGASGLVGGHCLDLLLKDDYYGKVVAVVRKELPVQHVKLEQLKVNFDDLPNELSGIKVDHVYCCLGTTMKKAGSKGQFKKVDFTYPVEAGKIAVQNGAEKYLLVSALGADAGSMIFYNKVKGKTEEALKKLGFPTVHIFQPSLLLGDRKESRAGEKAAISFFKLTAPFWVGPLKKYGGIPAKEVAFAMVVWGKRDNEGCFTHESKEMRKFYRDNQ